jgi:hypothetical protein
MVIVSAVHYLCKEATLHPLVQCNGLPTLHSPRNDLTTGLLTMADLSISASSTSDLVPPSSDVTALRAVPLA